jgi:arylsulfatase A-like enzyme
LFLIANPAKKSATSHPIPPPKISGAPKPIKPVRQPPDAKRLHKKIKEDKMRHKTITRHIAILCILLSALLHVRAEEKTNFILCMTDDQGWGDVGYMGHPHLKTPVLDEMAAQGLRFDRFYAPAPVCSPSRGGFITGRAPSRFGSYSFGYITRSEEITLGELAQSAGYATAHYGKWHLGPALKDHPLSPDGQGFDDWLSHDNYFDLNPMLIRNGAEPERIEGESSDILATETVRFMRECHKAEKPFLIVVWFPSPHTGLKAAKKDLELYAQISVDGKNTQEANYYGELSGVDRGMGTIRTALRELGIEKNTFLLFTSDNGPEKTGIGLTGGLSGHKHRLTEGGIRVPGIIEWPARIPTPRTTSIPAGTIDLFPTIREIIGANSVATDRPLDGISLLPLFDGKWTSRPKPMGFGIVKAGRRVEKDEKWLHGHTATGKARTFRTESHFDPPASFPGTRGAWIDNDFKLLDGKLYNLKDDAKETKDLAKEMPERLQAMKKALGAWQTSVARSLCGLDYK